MSQLRILVVAADPLARAGLATMMSGHPGYQVAGQVGDAGELEDALDVYGPDVVVWDLGWEPEASLERVADFREMSTPIIVLMPDDTHTVEAWSAGARGILPREIDVARLVAAATAVSTGMVVLDPGMAPPLVERGPIPFVREETLTPRELQVLQLLSEGLTNKAIAFRLDISEHTVKFHVNSILGKLSAQSRTEAVVNATRLGLILL